MHPPANGSRHFRRFGAVVALASLGWGTMFWWKFDDLFAPDPYRSTAEPGIIIPGDGGIGAQEQQQPQPWNAVRRPNNITNEEEETKKKDLPYPRTIRLRPTFGSNSLDGFEDYRLSTGSSSFSVPSQLLREENPETVPYHPVLDEQTTRHWREDRDALEYLLGGQFTEDYQTHCVDMADWQSHTFATCNQIHELGVLGGSAATLYASELDFLGRGNWRSAYSVRNLGADHADDDPPFVILKLFHLANNENFPFDPRAYEMHRIDAAISQKLTASPYVLDIYGHCGLTGIYEMGVSDLDVEARFRLLKKGKRRNHGRYPLDESTKLVYAAQMVRGVMDLHAADDDKSGGTQNDPSSNATIVHGDLKPENIVLVRSKHQGSKTSSSGGGGSLVAKLGDFNNSILRKWNRTSSSPCPYYQEMYRLSWGLGYRPPELLGEEAQPLDQSVDIFGVGGVLYYLLVGKHPYHQYPPGEETAAIKSGQLPPLPRPLRYPNQTDTNDNHRDTILDPPAVQPLRAILATIEAAMKIEPGDRPTAKQLVDVMKSYL